MNETPSTPIDTGKGASSGITPQPTSSGGSPPGGLLARGGQALVRPAVALKDFGVRYPGSLAVIVALLAVMACGAFVSYRQFEAVYHLRAARKCLERYHTIDAPHHLRVCMKVWPRDREVLLMTARAARRSSAFDMAEQALERYEEAHGVDDALTLERMLLRAERGETDTVERFFASRVREEHPDTPLILEAVTRAYLRNLRLGDAEKRLDHWAKLQPDNTQVLLFRGALCELRLQRGEAAGCYRKVVEIDPEHDDARLKLASALVDLGRAGEALPHLDYLHQRVPKDADIQVRLARCKELLGRPAEAVKDLDDVIARNPDYAPALGERGKLALQAGNLEEAEPLLRKAVLADPAVYSTRYQYYTCLTRLGKTAEAKEEAERLKVLEEDMRTLTDITSHRMQLAPNDPGLHVQVAQIYLRVNQVDPAVRWLHSALRLDPKYGPAHQMLAMYYLRIGNQGMAAYHRTQARSAGAGEASPSPSTPSSQGEKGDKAPTPPPQGEKGEKPPTPPQGEKGKGEGTAKPPAPKTGP